MIDRIQKVSSIEERLKSIENLSEVPSFLNELEDWTSDNNWHLLAIEDISNLIDLIETIIKEVENGS